jgi:hypothetical protein
MKMQSGMTFHAMQSNIKHAPSPTHNAAHSSYTHNHANPTTSVGIRAVIHSSPKLNISLPSALQRLGRRVIRLAITKSTPAIPRLRDNRTRTFPGVESATSRCTVGVAGTLARDEL